MSIQLIGAVGVKVKPVTKGFRGETKRGVLAELAGFEADVPVTADVRANTRLARAEIERLKRRYDGTEIDLRVRTNPGDLTRFRRALEGATKGALDDLTQMRDLMAQMRRDGESLDAFNVRGPWARASQEAHEAARATRQAMEGLRKMRDMRLDKYSGQMVKDLYKVHALADRPETIMGGTIKAFRDIDAQIKGAKERLAELNKLVADEKVGDEVLSDVGRVREQLMNLQSIYDKMLERHPEMLRNWHVRNQMSREEQANVARLAQETDNLRIAREKADEVVPQRSLFEDMLGMSVDGMDFRDGVRDIVESIDREIASNPETGREAWQEFWNKRFAAVDTYEARETLRRALQGDVFEEAAWDRIKVDLDEDTAKRLKDEVQRVKQLEQMFWRAAEGLGTDAEDFLIAKADADGRDLDRLERELKSHRHRTALLWEALHGADADRARWAGEQQSMTREEVDRVRRQVDRMREAQAVLYDVLAGKDGAAGRFEDLRGLLDPEDVERVERTVRRLVSLESEYFESLASRDPLAARRWADVAAGISEDDARRVRTRVEELRQSADLFWEALSGNSRAGDEWRRVSRGFSTEVVERIERDMRALGDAERQYWRAITSGDEVERHRWRSMEVDLDPENVRRVKQKMERLKEELDGKVAEIKAELTGSGLVAAHMAWLARTRVANIIPRVNAKALVLAEGALKSLAGFNIARSSWDTFERIFTKFDTFAAKTGLISTAVLGLGNAIGWATATGAAFIGSATRMLNIGLMGPAAFSALAASITITKAAWQDFSEAAKGNDEALAQLPKNARAAALAYRGMWEKIQKPIQARFWEGMGDSFERLAKEVLPLVGKGLADTALHAGKFGRGVNEAMLQLAKSGDLKVMLGNLSGMFDNLTRGAKPFFDVINRIGLRGSEYLPRFGEWLSDMAVSLDDFIVRSDRAGKINQWIESGVRETKNFGRAINGLTRMFYGLYKASVDVAGASTLEDVSYTWQKAADVMNREPFRSRMGLILKGAVDGTRDAGAGFRDWGRAMGESAVFVHDVEVAAGSLIRSVFDRITDITGNGRFQRGFLDMFTGLHSMFRDLDRSAGNVAAIFGEIGTAAGEAFRVLPPLFDSMTGAVRRVVEHLSPAFQALAPILTGHLAQMITGVGIVVEPLAAMIGGVAEAFAKWPSSVQNAVLALGGLTVLAANINSAFRRIADTAWFGRLQARAIESGRLADNFRGKLSAFQVPMVLASGVPDAFRKAGGAAEGAAGKVGVFRSAMGGIRSAASGIVGVLGGPWGLALLGAGAAIGLFAQHQARAEEKVRAVTDALDQQTGAATRLSKENLAEDFKKQFEQYGNELPILLKKLGTSQEEFLSAVNAGGTEYEQVMQRIRNATNDLAKNGDPLDPLTNKLLALGGGLSGFADPWVEKIQKARSEIEKMQGLHIPDVFRDVTAQVEQFAKSTGDAKARVEALSRAFSLLNGDKLSLTEAKHALADTTRSAESSLKDQAGNWLSLKGAINSTTGEIKATTESSSAWYRNLRSVRDETLQVAQAMYDQTGDIRAVEKYLGKQKDAWVANMVAAGANQKAAEKAWQTLSGMSDEEFTMALKLDKDGLEGDVMAAEMALRNLGGKEFFAKLGIRDDDVQRSLIMNLGDLDKWNESFAEARVGLNDEEAADKRHQIMLWLAELTEQRPDIKIDAQLNQEMMNAVHTELGNIEGKEYMAKLGINDVDAGRKLLSAATSLEEWDRATGTATAHLNPAEAEATRDALLIWLGHLAEENPTIKAQMDTDLAEKAAGSLKKHLDGLDGKEAKAAVSADGVAEARDGFIQLEEAANKVPSSTETDLNVRDNATPVLHGVEDQVSGLDGASVNTELTAQDNMTPTFQFASTQIEVIPDNKSTELSAQDHMSPAAEGASASLTTIPDSKSTHLTAQDNMTGPAQSATASVNSVPDVKTALLSATDAMSGVAAAAASMVQSIPTVWTTNLVGVGGLQPFAQRAFAAITAIPTVWTTNLVGVGNTTPFAQAARAAVMSVPTSWTTYISASGNVIGFAYAARAALASIPRQVTTYVTTVKSTVTKNADGNVLDGAGNVMAFNNGGVLSENHVAMISPAQKTFRVWAEPETGGEAYIPLSPSKRGRSTQILSEVASRFGYELMAFANGGVAGGGGGGPVKAGPTFNIVNHYPQAEPNSVLVDRTMAEYGHVTLGDF